MALTKTSVSEVHGPSCRRVSKGWASITRWRPSSLSGPTSHSATCPTPHMPSGTDKGKGKCPPKRHRPVAEQRRGHEEADTNRGKPPTVAHHV